MKEAIQIYKELFEPSDVLDKPYMIVCLNVIVAESDEEAEYLVALLAQVFIGIARGRMQPVQPPTNDLQALLTPREFEMAKQRFNDSLIGSEETVKEKLEAFIEEYGEIDELMGISYIYDQEKQFESFTRLQNIIEKLNQ